MNKGCLSSVSQGLLRAKQGSQEVHFMGLGLEVRRVWLLEYYKEDGWRLEQHIKSYGIVHLELLSLIFLVHETMCTFASLKVDLTVKPGILRSTSSWRVNQQRYKIIYQRVACLRNTPSEVIYKLNIRQSSGPPKKPPPQLPLRTNHISQVHDFTTLPSDQTQQ